MFCNIDKMFLWIFLVVSSSSYIEFTQGEEVLELPVCEPNCELELPKIGVKLKYLSDECKCVEGSCRCCFLLGLPLVEDEKFCMDAKIRPEQLELEAKLSLNNDSIYEFKASGTDPPPVCFPLPLPIPIPILVCLKAKDIYAKDGELHLCANTHLQIASVNLFRLHLNCAFVGLNGIRFSENR